MVDQQDKNESTVVDLVLCSGLEARTNTDACEVLDCLGLCTKCWWSCACVIARTLELTG